LISGPFHSGLIAVFVAAAVMLLLGSIASWFARGGNAPDEVAELAEATREGLVDDIDRLEPVATNGHARHTTGAHAIVRPVSTPVPRRLAADGRSISGRVVRADGYPVAGVALTLIDQRGHQVSRATGDAHGQYLIEPPAPGSYVLIVSATGHQPAAVNVSVNGHSQRLDVPLQGSGELTGTVRAAKTARPLPGATITLTDMRGEVVGAAVSGADGDYRCEGVVSGIYTLVVVAEHMRPTAATLTVPDSGLLHHDVELSPMAVLTGSVWADGRAVADAQIIISDADGVVLGSARTNDDGRYTVSDLTEGDYTVVARGYPPVTSRVTVTDGESGHDLRLGYEVSDR
jgi:uncharacterized surface anchored protein